jgi:undecaprenyl-diphosphatase
MNEWWALFYGFIQGITEFLPISSSGHLALIPKFFPLEDPGVVFDLVMHFGTAFAVMAYFRKDIKTLLKEGIRLIVTRDFKNEGIFFQNFLLSTIISFICIILFKDLAFAYGRTTFMIGFNLMFFGVLLYISDKTKGKDIDLVHEKDFKRAIIIGLSQSFAIFPGVSRSGITLTAARFSHLSRVEASRFSFLLSLPIILASVVYKLPAIIKGEAVQVELSIILIGIVVSFLVGIMSIHLFLKLIAKTGLWIFMVYRLILGIIIFLVVY